MEIFKIDRASASDATASGNFGGQVWMQRLITEQQSQDLELLVVSFEAGGRTRPHIHVVDQILHIISGRGIVATAPNGDSLSLAMWCSYRVASGTGMAPRPTAR